MDDTHCRNVMSNLWIQKQTQRFCDVILCTEDGQVWAHKSVVSANSSTFDTDLLCNNIIVNDMGNKPQEISLPGCSTAITETVVEFMYTGKAQLTTDNLLQCISFAHQYFMPELKQQCLEFAKNNTTSANWVGLMKFAMSSDSMDLNSILSDYVIQAADDIMLLENFLMLPVDFITYLLSCDKGTLNDKREIQLFKLVVSWISFSVCERKAHLEELIHTLCVTGLKYDVTKQFLDASTHVADEIRTHAKIAELLKVLEENQPVAEYGDVDDDATLDYSVETDESDAAQLTDDDFEYFPPARHVVKKRKSASAKQRLNKRKSSTPMRYEDSASNAARPPVKLKIDTGTGRPRGRPRKYPVTKLKTKILMQPKLTPLAAPCMQDEEDVKDEPRVEPKEEQIDEPSEKVKKTRKPRTTRPVDPNREKIQCPRCPCTFNAAITFRVHLRGHGITEPWMCNKCNFETKHYGMFLSHMRRKHKEGDARVQCPKCPKMFSSESACNYHVRGHGSEQPMLCDICGFTTKHYASMNLHKRMHSGKVFRCPSEGCTYSEPKKAKYLDHLAAHEGRKNHICAICGKGYSARKHLLRHEKSHNVTDPKLAVLSGNVFKCHYEGCSYSEARKNRYLDHIAGHQGIKNHTCSVCGKGFGARKHLLRHENTHNEKKAIKCEFFGLCDYASSRQDKLRQHLKIHHPTVALERGYVTEEWAAKQQVNLATLAARPPGNKQQKRSKKSNASVAPTMPQHVNNVDSVPENVAFADMVREEVARAALAITKTSPLSQCGNEASNAGGLTTGNVSIDMMVQEEASRAVRAITMASPMPPGENEPGVIGDGQLVASPSSHSIQSIHSMHDPADPNSPITQNNAQSSHSTQDVRNTQNVHGTQNVPSTHSIHSVPLPVGMHQMPLPVSVSSALSEEMLHYVYAAQHHAWGQYQQVYPIQQEANQPK